MKTFLLLFVATLSLSLGIAQNTSQIKSAEISFLFVNDDVEGTLSEFNSNSSIDFENLENSKIEGTVDVETISTGNSIRNWSLRRKKYFNASDYPKIKFASKTIRKEGDAILVTGSLTIKETTKSVTFKFERKEKKLIGKTSLYSSDYGVSIKSDRKKNKVNVKITLQLQ